MTYFNVSSGSNIKCAVCGIVAAACICVHWPHAQRDAECLRVKCLPAQEMAAPEDHTHQRQPRGPINVLDIGMTSTASSTNIFPMGGWGSTRPSSG